MKSDNKRTTGFPSPAENDVEEPIDLSSILDLKNPAKYPVRAKGLAFQSRGILDDDILIVDTSLPPKSGKLVIASYQGDVILAQLKQQGSKWFLLSGNGKKEAIPVNPDMDIEIWGIVKSVVREDA